MSNSQQIKDLFEIFKKFRSLNSHNCCKKTNSDSLFSLIRLCDYGTIGQGEYATMKVLVALIIRERIERLNTRLGDLRSIERGVRGTIGYLQFKHKQTLNFFTALTLATNSLLIVYIQKMNDIIYYLYLINYQIKNAVSKFDSQQKQYFMDHPRIIGQYQTIKRLSSHDFVVKKLNLLLQRYQTSNLLLVQAFNQFVIKEEDVQKINGQTNLILPHQTFNIDSKSSFYFCFKLQKNMVSAQQVPLIQYYSELYCLTILYSFLKKVVLPLTKFTTFNLFQILKKQNIWIENQNSYLLMTPRIKLQLLNSSRHSRRLQKSSQDKIFFPFTQINQKKVLKLIAQIFWQIFFGQQLKNYFQLINRTFLKQLLSSMFKSQITLFQLQTILQDKSERKKYINSKRKSFHYQNMIYQRGQHKRISLLDTLDHNDCIIQSQAILKPYNNKKSNLKLNKVSSKKLQASQLQKGINFQFTKQYIPPSFTRKCNSKRRNSMFRHSFNNNSTLGSEQKFAQSLNMQSNSKRKGSKSRRKYKKNNFDDLFEQKEGSKSKLKSRTIDIDQQPNKEVKKYRYFQHQQQKGNQSSSFKIKSRTIDVSQANNNTDYNFIQYRENSNQKKIQRKRLKDRVNQMQKLIQNQRIHKNHNQILSKSQQKAMAKFKNQLSFSQDVKKLSSYNSRSIDDKAFRVNFQRKTRQKDTVQKQRQKIFGLITRKQSQEIEQTNFQQIKQIVKQSNLNFIKEDVNKYNKSQQLLLHTQIQFKVDNLIAKDKKSVLYQEYVEEDKMLTKNNIQQSQLKHQINSNNQQNSFKNQFKIQKSQNIHKFAQVSSGKKNKNQQKNKFLSQQQLTNEKNIQFVDLQVKQTIKSQYNQSKQKLINKIVNNTKKTQIQNDFFKNRQIEQANFDQIQPISSVFRAKTSQQNKKRKSSQEKLQTNSVFQNKNQNKITQQVAQRPPLPIKKAKIQQFYDNDQIQEIILKPVKQTKKLALEPKLIPNQNLNNKIKTKTQISQKNKPKQQQNYQNKRQHTNQSSIASSGGPKKSMSKIVKEYITMINKMGQAVAKTARISKKLGDIQWYVGIFFIYKRFLYERKKIQKCLKQNVPKLSRYSQIDLDQWRSYINSEQKLNVYNKIMEDNKNIEQSIIKMHKRLITRPNISQKIKLIANLSQRTYQESKIAIQYTIQEYDSIVQRGMLEDEQVFIHICEMLNSCLILAELDKKVQQRQSLAKMVTIRRTPQELENIATMVYDLYDEES